MADSDFIDLVKNFEQIAGDLVSQLLVAVKEAAGEGRGATPTAEREVGAITMRTHLRVKHSVPENWLPKDKSLEWLSGFHEALFFGADDKCEFNPASPTLYFTCSQCEKKIYNDQTEAEDQPIWADTEEEIFCHAGPSPEFSRFHVPAE